MFELSEILNAIYKNRKKSIIAGITVAWGVLLLTLLIGTGNGLKNGVKKLFSDYTIKTIEVFGGEASISDNQVTKGDLISFNIIDLKKLVNKFNAVENISPIVNVQLSRIFSKKKSLNHFYLLGVNENYFKIRTLPIDKGRSFNPNDMDRKTVVIGYSIAEKLFNNTNCIGRLLFIKSTGYTVIGVTKNEGLFNDSGYNIYTSYENALSLEGNLNFDEFAISLKNNIDSENFQKELKSFLSKEKGINPNDKTALLFNNVESTIKSFNTLFKIINLFLWFIGISFLISGILSVFNIMTVIVRDRIGEFGIRKAVGASPLSIQAMVLTESLIITIISGLVGLIIGFVLIYLINLYLSITEGNNSFVHIDINKYIILIAVLLLSISGCIAGIIPARKAANTRPVEALRELNN
ncbi:MAG: ABC transporter permease [Aestuariibaculum sp.]